MSALLDMRDLADLRAVRVAGLQNTGVGGDTWTVVRATGDGVRPAETTTARITGYISQERPDRIVVVAAGAQIPSAAWRLVILDGAIQAGDLLTSVADPTIQFVTERPLPGVLYPEALVRPC